MGGWSPWGGGTVFGFALTSGIILPRKSGEWGKEKEQIPLPQRGVGMTTSRRIVLTLPAAKSV